ncbi:MAG: class II fructose-bisphosphate aldolase [Clostridia bacterium]|nr:class II fructose-bisphosphate aldolase [Clostridia bacterium]
MLVSMIPMLQKARAEGYGVAAPSVNNEDAIYGAVAAAEECNTPVILDISFGLTRNVVRLGRLAEDIARDARVPVAINQDHGREFEHAIWCIRAGFTDIMVDRSQLPFEENIAQVADLTRIAHAVNVGVEAELGHVGQGYQYEIDRDAALTDPAMAKEYCERTGIDCLAIAIGTAHGEYKGTPYLDFDRLHAIFDKVSLPLVLHGGSGTGDENLAKATHEGISKVNLATDLFMAGWQAALDSGCRDGRTAYRHIERGYKEKLMHFMRLFGQVNKA